jgi:hypothetical protein
VVTLYVVIVILLLVLPALVFVLASRERGVGAIGGRRGRAGLHTARCRGVTLPADAREPVSVFAEGVELQPGRDYELRDRYVVLITPLQPHAPSVWRDFVTTAFGVGFYGRGAQLDVHFATASGDRRGEVLSVVPLDDALAAQPPVASPR